MACSGGTILERNMEEPLRRVLKNCLVETSSSFQLQHPQSNQTLWTAFRLSVFRKALLDTLMQLSIALQIIESELKIPSGLSFISWINSRKGKT